MNLDINTKHHIWCNYFTRPREGCKMCEEFYKKYPMDCSPDELLIKHFPKAQRITDMREEKP